MAASEVVTTKDLLQQLKRQQVQTVVMQLQDLDLAHLVRYIVLEQHSLPVAVVVDMVVEIQQAVIMLVLEVEADMYILLKQLLITLLVAY